MTTGRPEEAIDFGPIYEDATYQYFGEAGVGTALTTASGRVSRISLATGQEQFANGGKFDNLFTDLATVQGLF